MYLRFTTTQIDDDSKRPQGVFVAAYELLDSGELPADEWTALRTILDWYKAHLPTPPDSFVASRAIFWFRAEAGENIRRIWELVTLLRAHGRHVNVQNCRHLGNIVFYDKYQVAAYPSQADGKITTR
jgi:hypothetical protein